MLAVIGGLAVAGSMWGDWFRRTATERGSGEVAGPPVDLTGWDELSTLGIALVVVAGVVVVLGLLRLMPWVVGFSGIALVALMVIIGVQTLGSGSLECCAEIATETTPRIGFIVAGLAALTVTAGGFWAAESD
jgi:hypothetical protein